MIISTALFIFLLPYCIDANPDSFLTVWKPSNTDGSSSAAQELTLPVSATGTYNCSLDWGDGSPLEYITDGSSPVSHTYSSSTTYYTINITGTFTDWTFLGGVDCVKLTEIAQWGSIGLSTGGQIFMGM